MNKQTWQEELGELKLDTPTHDAVYNLLERTINEEVHRALNAVEVEDTKCPCSPGKKEHESANTTNKEWRQAKAEVLKDYPLK